MYFSVADSEELVDIEDLTLDQTLVALAEAEAELARAFNSAHVASLKLVIGELYDQLDWLVDELVAEAVNNDLVGGVCSDGPWGWLDLA